MTPEERKVFAMRQDEVRDNYSVTCHRFYPRCCGYHKGVDDTLALLTPALPATPWPKGTKFYGITP